MFVLDYTWISWSIYSLENDVWAIATEIVYIQQWSG